MLKNIKKLLSLALVSAFSITMCVPTFAASNNSENSIDSMFDAAVTNYKQTGEKPVYATLTNKNTGKKYKVQMFESVQNKNSFTADTAQQHHTKSYVFSVEKKYIQPYDDIQSNIEQGKNEWDGSVSVKGYLNLEYDSDGTYTLLTNVNGGWHQSDYSTYVSDRRVYYACLDPSVYYSQSAIQYPSSNSFSYNTNFGHAVQENGNATACGAHIWCTLHHGTGSWTFDFSNTLFNSMGMPNLSDR